MVRLAQPGEREAVFNIAEGAFKNRPKDPTVTAHLVSNPEIETAGTVRYISPQADPATRTYTVRVSLPEAPLQMRLGANVVGTVTLDEGETVAIPGSALFQKDGKPAVWLVEKDNTVQLNRSRSSATKATLSSSATAWRKAMWSLPLECRNCCRARRSP